MHIHIDRYVFFRCMPRIDLPICFSRFREYGIDLLYDRAEELDGILFVFLDFILRE